MASTGLLLLLLMSSLFLLCSLSDPQPSSQQKLHSRKKRDLDIFGTGVTVLGIPSMIEWYIEKFKTIVLNERSDAEKMMKTLKEQFEALNRKQSITTKWHAWASGPYQEAEVNIRLGLKNFNDVFDECKTSCKDEKYKALFKTHHEHMVSALDKLHILLTSNETSFIADFQSLLSDHVRCHENDILEFSLFISALMMMGSTANALYYNIHEVNKLDDLAQMTFDTDAVMSQIYRNCLLNPDKYIEMDVFDLIDENQDRQQLAKKIKDDLDKKYNRYDWMVVVFLTRHSNRKNKILKVLNKHLLKEFMEVTKGEVSVAVAKQAKGEHKRAKDIQNAIKQCVSASASCDSIKKALDTCKNTKIKDAYTAIHVYYDESHDSVELELKEEITNGGQSQLEHFYTGTCKKLKLFKGQFRVMIKSDGEINHLKLCQNEKCGGPDKGTCVPLQNILKETCECKKDYSGLKCGTSLDDFKKMLQDKTGKVEMKKTYFQRFFQFFFPK